MLSDLIYASAPNPTTQVVPSSMGGGGGGGGQGGSLITIHKEKKHLFTFHMENKLNSHFTWN